MSREMSVLRDECLESVRRFSRLVLGHNQLVPSISTDM